MAVGIRVASWLQESALPRVSSSYGYQWWNGLSVVGDQIVERIEAKGLGGQRNLGSKAFRSKDSQSNALRGIKATVRRPKD